MIKELRFARFRGHDAKYTFGPNLNIIKGPNEAGKSTIKEAIAFVWMGTDSDGTKNPDHLITVGQTAAQVAITTGRATFVRDKKVGATSSITRRIDGIPDVKLNQTELMAQVGISQEVFMSSWAVGYFMKLKSDAKLKVLGEIAKIDRRTLLSTIVDINHVPAQVKFINPKIDADAVAGLRRAEQNKRQALESQVQSLQAQLATIPTEAKQLDPKDHEMKIVLHETVLQDHSLYRQNITKWKAENDKRSTAATRLAELKTEIAKLDESVKQKKVEFASLTDTRASLELKRQDLISKGDELKGKIRQIELSLPKKPSAQQGVCPCCGQQVHADHIDSLMRDYESDVSKYNEHSREVASHNEKINLSLQDLSKSLDVVVADLRTVGTKITETETLGKQMSQSLRRHEESLEHFRAIPTDLLPTPAIPEGDEQKALAERDRLKAELHAYKMFETQKVQLDQQLAQAFEGIKKHLEAATTYAAVEAALLKLPELETQATLEKVNISGVHMSLVDGDLIVKNADGVDYRCLSDGRRMKTDIALCVAIKRAIGANAPDWIFVDNADLMDEEVSLPEGVQVLVAKVDPTLTEVTVVSL